MLSAAESQLLAALKRALFEQFGDRLLGRWLHKRGLEKALRAPLAPRAPISEAKRRRLEEARALVEEAFDGDSVLP